MAAPIVHRRLLFSCNVGLKALFVGLLAFGAFSGLDQFDGKAFGWRLILYPIAAIIVPVAWRLRGSPQPYPYAADMLLVAPFLVDVAGNALDLYDSIVWWDDLNHLMNWALLCGALGAVLLRTTLRPLVLFAVIVGFGAAAAILWEIGEYFAFIRGGDEVVTAYTDTLGDEILGLTGGALAALTVAVIARRRDARRAG
ncbi:hypothetical protein [Gaiella sp.]|uniref:hypothetical protein n=1 Tax=Gaiella sp. TaxID=2663207 RepID=UPI003262E1A3